LWPRATAGTQNAVGAINIIATAKVQRSLRPLLAGVAVAGIIALTHTTTVSAATTDELGCYTGKMKASVSQTKSLGRCQVRLGKNGLASEFDACVAGAVADASFRIDVTDANAARADFACPGDLESLALGELSSWQKALGESAVFQGNALPNVCVRKRAQALSKYAAKYATCLRRGFGLAAPAIDACAARALAAFHLAWTRAALAAECTSDEAGTVAARIEDALDAQARLLRVTCGDGIPAGSEQCDDGNPLPGDGCDEHCILEECGNRVVQFGENCDTGGESASCDADCTPVACGDGLTNPSAGEQCDTPAQTASCERSCRLPVCGDGTRNVLAGEQCDGGGESATCDDDCTVPACGDDILNVQAGEQCDDGNRQAGDGCDGGCRLESCGDGRRDAAEECDDGNADSADGCSSLCKRETCGLVAGVAKCLYCPAGSSPNSNYTACVCDAGYEPVGSSCRDIDECASDPCGAGPCDNLPGTWSCPIPCTEAAFHAALQACGGASRTITFDCAATTILLSDATNGPRRTRCDGLLIDGMDRGITFEMNPKCWGRAIPPEQCRVALDPDGTCSCPDENSGTVFLSLEGDNMTVRNLAVRYFFDGIKTGGNDNTVENIDFERICDEATGNISGVGNLYTGITARTACGKCMQNYGQFSATAADPKLRRHYNAIVRDSLFTDCQQPIRMTNAGRYLIEHTRMEGFYTSGIFRCLGPRFTTGIGDTQVVHMTGSELDGCDNGVRIGGSVEALVWGNTFVNNEFRGLLAGSSARVSMWDNVIRDNGGLASSEAGLGGVGITEDARIDLGGGSLLIDGQMVSSPGRNVLCGNVSPQASPREVHNTTALTVSAENNFWCTMSPGSRVTGAVDTDPFLPALP